MGMSRAHSATLGLRHDPSSYTPPGGGGGLQLTNRPTPLCQHGVCMHARPGSAAAFVCTAAGEGLHSKSCTCHLRDASCTPRRALGLCRDDDAHAHALALAATCDEGVLRRDLELMLHGMECMGSTPAACPFWRAGCGTIDMHVHARAGTALALLHRVRS